MCHQTVRTLIMVSTSFPWNPTSVYLVASTLMKGAPANFAKRRAISVCIWVEQAMRHTGRERVFAGRNNTLRQSVRCHTIWEPSPVGALGRGQVARGHVSPFHSRANISKRTLPTPVGPIIRMFLGVTSSLSGLSSCMRRQRLRMAMAMARLASCCPTMWLLRY